MILGEFAADGQAGFLCQQPFFQNSQAWKALMKTFSKAALVSTAACARYSYGFFGNLRQSPLCPCFQPDPGEFAWHEPICILFLLAEISYVRVFSDMKFLINKSNAFSEECWESARRKPVFADFNLLQRLLGQALQQCPKCLPPRQTLQPGQHPCMLQAPLRQQAAAALP